MLTVSPLQPTSPIIKIRKNIKPIVFFISLHPFVNADLLICCLAKI